MKFEESIEWLYGTQTFGIKLGLENTERLLENYDVLKRLEGVKVIHVAGTNGKGSVCAFAERILRDAGLRTGLFTSPHLVSYRERIQVSGERIDEESVARILTELRHDVTDWDPHPTFFELSLLLALRYFLSQECEVVLLETGMGGRLDSTNAVPASVSVITPIGLDHREWLGETIREIAGEKAGILKPNTPAVIADLHPEARDVVGRRALTLGIPYIEAHPLPMEWELGLKGPHQRENAALAVEAACRVEGDRLTQEGIRESLGRTSWPGRFEEFSEKITVDGAHNPEAAAALVESWRERHGEEKAHLIFGVANSKDVVALLRELIPIVATVTLVPIQSERRLSEEEMGEALIEAGGVDLPLIDATDLSEALAAANSRDGRSLLTGSLFLVGEARGLLGGEAVEVSGQ
ncbi:MAG: folylpolyglutamate synthase/dihydrofolate synthase family protein [Verrucomicrobiota bacterium]